MIKTRLQVAPDRTMFLLGVTEGNVERLREGKPLVVDLAELGGSGEVVLAYGRDKPAIIADLAAAGIEVPEQLRRFAEEHPE